MIAIKPQKEQSVAIELYANEPEIVKILFTYATEDSKQWKEVEYEKYKVLINESKKKFMLNTISNYFKNPIEHYIAYKKLCSN